MPRSRYGATPAVKSKALRGTLAVRLVKKDIIENKSQIDVNKAMHICFDQYNTPESAWSTKDEDSVLKRKAR
jgi:hypothetical protein